MPLLDVSFVTEDPMLADTIDVRRRVSVVGTNGREVAAPDTLFAGMMAVVTQQDPAALMRTEAGVMVPRRIFVATRLRLVALAPGCLADEVTWNGTTYTVDQVMPYPTYGGGLYEAICEFRGPVPPPQ